MIDRVQLLSAGLAMNCFWFLEHNSVYTKGSSALPTDLSHIDNIPIIESNRGGQYTYHGPGQRIIYTILNLRQLYDGNPDIRRFIEDIAAVIISAFQDIGLKSYLDTKSTGIWTETPSGNKKIVSMGFKIKNWIIYHGIAININPDMSRFQSIHPCGLEPNTMTSLSELGITISFKEFDDLILAHFSKLWNLGEIRLHSRSPLRLHS